MITDTFLKELLYINPARIRIFSICVHLRIVICDHLCISRFYNHHRDIVMLRGLGGES